MQPEELPNYSVLIQISDGYLALGAVPVPPIGTVVGIPKELTADYSNTAVEVTAHEWDISPGIEDNHLPRVHIKVRTKPAKLS